MKKIKINLPQLKTSTDTNFSCQVGIQRNQAGIHRIDPSLFTPTGDISSISCEDLWNTWNTWNIWNI